MRVMFQETIMIVVLFEEIIITKVVLLGEKIRRAVLFQEIMRVVSFEMIRVLLLGGIITLKLVLRRG
jgi:hypothetical protein